MHKKTLPFLPLPPIHTTPNPLLSNNFKHTKPKPVTRIYQASCILSLYIIYLYTHLSLTRVNIMCNPSCKPSSAISPFLCPTTETHQVINCPPHDQVQDQDELHRWPTPNEVINNRKKKRKIYIY